MSWHMKLDSTWCWLIILRVLLSGVYAMHNVTVDDADPSITYTGTWLTTDLSDRFMSTTHYTRTQGSYATFSFTGASKIYFMGLGNTNPDVDTDIAIILDGRTYIVNIYREMSDHLQAILWASEILDPTITHTLECRKTSDNNGGRDLNVDAFILTIPDVAVPSSTSLRTASTTRISPLSASDSSSRSSAAPMNPSNSSGVATTIVGVSTLSSGATAGVGSSVVWNPSLGAYVPASTPDFQPSGTIQNSINGPAGSDSLSKSAVVGIVFGAVGFFCLIALLFFYLGRRRSSMQQPITPSSPYFHYQKRSVGSQDDHQIGQSLFLESVQSSLKERQHNHEGSPPQETDSSFSSSNTQSRSGHIRSSLVVSESVTETTTWITGPPAYTVRPVSGHYSNMSVSGTGETLTLQHEPPQAWDVKAK